MKKKIGILTINDNRNFGNRLQNYATQEILKKNNVKVETIQNIEGKVGFGYIKFKMKIYLKKVLNLKKYRRDNAFLKFNKNIVFSEYKIDKKHIPVNLDKKYDYFATGSDQVWNPSFGRMSDIDFLTFASKEKRISFSASFGINDIPYELKDYYKKRIEDFNKVSVREYRGKEIIEELTERKDVEVLIDPTMMLTDEEWDKVSKKPKNMIKCRYILNYFLEKLSKEISKEIEKIAKENNCEIINIMDNNDPFYNSGPSEFLYLEKHAFLICTDSFHSSVFAILYNRPFVIFNREYKGINMNSRIETLIYKFKLKNRQYNGTNISKENLNHNYIETYKILEEERKRSNDFLRKALDIKESE